MKDIYDDLEKINQEKEIEILRKIMTGMENMEYPEYTSFNTQEKLKFKELEAKEQEWKLENK